MLLLAEYEAMRRRFNADRAAVADIIQRGESDDS